MGQLTAWHPKYHWGKLAGLLAGGLLVQWPGAVVGFGLGYVLDWKTRFAAYNPQAWKAHGIAGADRLALTVTTATMGYVAKADGRVSEQEIAVARTIMDELGLDAGKRRLAIHFFAQGKRPDMPLHGLLRRLRRQQRRSEGSLERFVQFQLRVACADGDWSPRQKQVLLRIVQRLGFPPAMLESMYTEHRRRRQQQGQRNGAIRMTLKGAYGLLGLAESASTDEVRRAYRRHISRHHPDRMVARGLPDSAVKAAARKTQEVRAAYEEIRKARGF